MCTLGWEQGNWNDFNGNELLSWTHKMALWSVMIILYDTHEP